MTKNLTKVIVSLVFFALLLSGCKLPASTAPTELPMTTPIRIQTDSPALMTQTAVAKAEVTPTPDAIDEAVPTPTETPEPTEEIAIPTLTRPAEYTLREGENPYCIARRFDLNPGDLITLNNVGDIVPAGTVLQIPQTGSWESGSRSLRPHPTTHTVQAGETIYRIACLYGDVSPEAIIAANNLEEPYTLTTGQSLRIP